jgi:hypothetical protein
MFVSFYTISKQMLKIFWSSPPTNFSYEPPLVAFLSGRWIFPTRNLLRVEKTTRKHADITSLPRVTIGVGIALLELSKALVS